MDTGDFIIVVNAAKVLTTGRKLDQKKYYRHSGWIGGLKETSLRDMTRTHPSLQLGVSTRGAIALIRGAQACALLNDRDYILPEDVQRMALPVLAHRVLPSPEAKMKGVTAERILVAVMENVPVPIRLS